MEFSGLKKIENTVYICVSSSGPSHTETLKPAIFVRVSLNYIIKNIR